MESFARLKDNFGISALLISNESCVSSTLDLEDFVDHAFKQLSNRNVKRSDYYYIIASYINSHPCPQLSSIIDRLPSFIEAAANDSVEEDAFLVMFEELLNHSSAEVKDQLKKLLTKLVTSLVKGISKHPESHISFRALELLVKSPLRPELSPYSKQVCPACLAAVDTFSNRNHLTSTFALFASTENPDSWSNHFTNLAMEGHLTLVKLGIVDPASRSGVALVLPASLLPPLKEIKSSTVRAVNVMERFLTVCALLKKMLVYGCATGAVSLNLTALVSLCPWLFEVKAGVDTEDRANYIVNNQGFSPVDISLVISKMKIGLIEVITQLFALNPPSLLMFGQALHKPLAVLSGQAEVNKVPSLKLALIKAMSAAVRCFPSLVAENMEGRSIHLLSWLEQEVQHVTALTSLISSDSTASATAASTVSSSSKCNDAESTELILMLIAACEQILVHTAASLGPKIRQSFEDLVGQVLLCLSKGLVYPQFSDRRMHRATEHCEFLRQSPELQAAFLRMGCTEVLCGSARSGLGSTNVSLLKRVAEMALAHPTTAGEAARTLLVINSMLHPSTVSLPAIPAVDLGLAHVNKVVDQEEKKRTLEAEQQRKSVKEESTAASAVTVAVAEVPADPVVVAAAAPVVEKASESSASVPDVVQKKEESKEEPKPSLKREREPEVAAAAVKPAEEAAKRARPAEPDRRAIIASLNANDDDDDDDLPDLK